MADTAIANPRTDYERRDVSPRLIAVIALGLFLTLCAIPVLLLAFFPSTTSDRPKLPHLAPPEPRLQTDPQADLHAFRARETAQLDSYGWIDRTQGVVHIPIEQAMQRSATTGIPDWPEVKP